MSEGQATAMFTMFAVGLIALPFAPEAWNAKNMRPRVAVIAWVAIWMLPPLATLWIKGVFG